MAKEKQLTIGGALRIGRPFKQFNLKMDPPLADAIRVYCDVKNIKLQHMFEKLCIMLLTGELLLENRNTVRKRLAGTCGMNTCGMNEDGVQNIAEFMDNIKVDMVLDAEATHEQIAAMLGNPMDFADKW